MCADDGKGAKADDLVSFQSKQTMFFLDLLITGASKSFLRVLLCCFFCCPCIYVAFCEQHPH